MDSLLDGHMKTLCRKQGALREWITKHSGRVGTIFGVFFLVAAYLAGYRAAHDFLNEQLLRLQNFAQVTPTVSDKLDFMLRLISEGSWARFSFFIGMSAIFLLVLSVVFGIVIGSLAENRASSFVVLSEKAKQNREEVLRKEKKRWISFFGSVLADFAAALAAHGVFSHFLSKMLL
jgi:hypothetical protein